MSKLMLVTVLAMAAVMHGCASYSRPIAAGQPTTAAERNFENVWRASLRTLRKYNFEIDRQDRRAGLITTRPLVGKHGFEFWRRDAATGSDVAEGTLQTIYRTASVTIGPTSPEAQTFTAAVEITVSRLARQHLQLTTVSQAYDMFTLPGDQKHRRKYLPGDGAGGAGGSVLVRLGRDKKLEAKLAAAIRGG